MIFRDRIDAGIQLGQLLQKKLKDDHCIVLGLPRGGVVIAAEVAKVLHAPLDILCPRKVGAPHNPELAIGAVSASGNAFYFPDLIANLSVSRDYIAQAQEREIAEAKRRLKLYRAGKPELSLKGRTAILVDDGIATGATMRVAILEARHLQAKKVLMAVPVAPPDTYREIAPMTDGSYALDLPAGFYAVGQFYEEFDQVTDDEVIHLLKSI